MLYPSWYPYGSLSICLILTDHASFQLRIILSRNVHISFFNNLLKSCMHTWSLSQSLWWILEIKSFFALEASNIVLESFSNTFLFICLSFTNNLLVRYAMNVYMNFFTSLTSSSLYIGDFDFNLDVYTNTIFTWACPSQSLVSILIFMLNSSYEPKSFMCNLYSLIHHEFVPVNTCS